MISYGIKQNTTPTINGAVCTHYVIRRNQVNSDEIKRNTTPTIP